MLIKVPWLVEDPDCVYEQETDNGGYKIINGKLYIIATNGEMIGESMVDDLRVNEAISFE